MKTILVGSSVETYLIKSRYKRSYITVGICIDVHKQSEDHAD